MGFGWGWEVELVRIGEEGRVVIVDEGRELAAEQCSFGEGFGIEEHLLAESGLGGSMGVGAEGGEDFQSVGG